MVKIGLTGGICTGKSYILDVFKKFNAYTLEADVIAKNILFTRNSPLLDELSTTFGDDIINVHSGINKEKFSKVLFEDAKKREILSLKILPHILQERDSTYRELKKNSNYDFFIYESALLVESNSYKDFEKIIVVYCTPDEQLERLMRRDSITEEAAMQKIKSQYPLSEKLKVANYTVDTSGNMDTAERNALETIYLIKEEYNLE
jgi:dephospho-CoA kinase